MPFKNIVGKGENDGSHHFLLFPQCFLPCWRQKSSFELLLFFVCKCLQWMVDSEILSFGEDLTCVKVKGMSICEGFWLTLSQTSPCFYVSAVQILKTLWKKEKLLVVNNFSFTHSVFLHIWRTLSFFFKFEIVVCKLFQFGRVQNLSFGKQLKQKLLETSWALDSGE